MFEQIQGTQIVDARSDFEKSQDSYFVIVQDGLLSFNGSQKVGKSFVAISCATEQQIDRVVLFLNRHRGLLVTATSGALPRLDPEDRLVVVSFHEQFEEEFSPSQLAKIRWKRNYRIARIMGTSPEYGRRSLKGLPVALQQACRVVDERVEADEMEFYERMKKAAKHLGGVFPSLNDTFSKEAQKIINKAKKEKHKKDKNA